MHKFVIVGLIVAGVAVVSAVIAISMVYLTKDNTQTPEDYLVGSREQLFAKHDVIVDGTIISFSKGNSTNDFGDVTMHVNEYFKNPQNKSELVVRGEFGLTGDYCKENPGNCKRVLAYLYQDENGNLLQGESFTRITEECDANCILGSA
jgi:hypothetical protein